MARISHDARARKAFGVSVETLTRRTLKVWDSATESDIEAGARWYDEAGRLADHLAAVHAVPIETVAAVISALSPRTDWGRNVLGARDVLAGATPTYCLAKNVERAQRILDDHAGPSQLRGPKTRRFARNILGNREAVTVDVWMCKVLGVDPERELQRVGAYDAAEHAVRLAARRRGVDPATMQATTWVVARNGRAS